MSAPALQPYSTSPGPDAGYLPPGYSGIPEHSEPFHAFLEHSSTYLFPLVFIPSFYFSLTRLYELELLWLLLVALPISLVMGDLVSGLVHWFADTYFYEDTPVVGKALIKPFRMHHVYPKDITTHGLVSLVGNVCILAVPLLLLCLYLLWISDHGLLAFGVLCVALMSAATAATNKFHMWAHQDRPNALVRALQRIRLVLPPTHHQIHHNEPHDRHYCITNGWLNPVLNRIHFFRGLEAGLGLLGIEPTEARRERSAHTNST